tara:strand:- start:74 stop:553 length:480 start_codon:yes stop_codon:yes gene_type:complete
MTVREAKFTDIPKIVGLALGAHERSIYKGTEVQVDIQHMKRLLMTIIQRHGGKGENATCVLVSERDGVVEGCMIAVALRIQMVCDKLEVMDLFFYQSPRSMPADARRLLQGVVNWAKGMKNVVQITIGTTDSIEGYQRVERLYRRTGFRRAGAIYGMKV